MLLSKTKSGKLLSESGSGTSSLQSLWLTPKAVEPHAAGGPTLPDSSQGCPHLQPEGMLGVPCPTPFLSVSLLL